MMRHVSCILLQGRIQGGGGGSWGSGPPPPPFLGDPKTFKNGHSCKNLISGSQHIKQSENTISGSENININVFLTNFDLIIIIITDFTQICQINSDN